MSYYEPLPDEKQRSENIRSVIWAICITFGLICSFVYGLAFLSWTEPTMEEIYRNKRMGKEIEVLQNQMQYYGALIDSIKKYDLPRFENHKHHFWTGKIK